MASPPLWKGGNWIFELNEIRGTNIFQNKGGRGGGGVGERQVFEIFIEGEITGDETSTENKISK